MADEALEDDFLIRADKNPNSHGVQALFPNRPYDVSAGHDVLLVWGDQVEYGSFGNAHVIHLASFDSQPENNAYVLIPISTSLERSGTFSNFEGKQNRFEKVFDKPRLVEHASEIFGRLGA